MKLLLKTFRCTPEQDKKLKKAAAGTTEGAVIRNLLDTL